MSFPKGYFDNAQLNVLESAFRLACLELGIDRADELQRERVAILIARNHRATYGNAAQLKDYAVQHFFPCKHYKGPRSKEEQWIITVNRRGTLTPLSGVHAQERTPIGAQCCPLISSCYSPPRAEQLSAAKQRRSWR